MAICTCGFGPIGGCVKCDVQVVERENDIEFLRWHAELCREDAAQFYRDHRRYEYLRCLNVMEFKAIFERCLKGERFDDVIDACIRGCPPGCRVGAYPGCVHCMSPISVPHERNGVE